jgi:hypothetical protein
MLAQQRSHIRRYYRKRFCSGEKSDVGEVENVAGVKTKFWYGQEGIDLGVLASNV